jgi:hypothetical protein
MVDWQSPLTIFNELGARVYFQSFFGLIFFFPPPYFAIAGRCLYQARACYRRNLSVRVFHRDDSIHRAQGSWY